MKFTGYHRLEKDLWVSGLQPDSSAIADQLLADVKEIAAKSKTVEPTRYHLQRRQGAARRGRDRQDHGRGGALLAHRPLGLPRQPPGLAGGARDAPPRHRARDAALQKALDARFSELNKLLESHRVGAGSCSYTDLTEADIKALTVALDALSEEVSKVPGGGGQVTPSPRSSTRAAATLGRPARRQPRRLARRLGHGCSRWRLPAPPALCRDAG